MGFFLYLAQAGIYGMLLWAVYCAAWRGSTAHRGSRALLLLAAVLSLLLPLIRVSLEAPLPVYHITLPEFVIGTTHRGASRVPGPFAGLPWMYWAVSAVVLARYVVTLLWIALRLKKGVPASPGQPKVILRSGVGPGTLWRLIFFPGEAADDIILRHEYAHIRAGHRWDALVMLLLRVPFWALPHLWLIARELRMVHEFEADDMAAEGGGTAQYAELLLAHTFGTKRFPLAQFFIHHPLKRRIMMLQKNDRSAPVAYRLLLVATLLLLVCGAAVFVQCRHKEPGAAFSPVNRREALPGVTLSGSPDHVYPSADTMPRFKGDLADWLGKNLRYPESARSLGHEGRVVVRFYLDRAGHVRAPVPLKASSDAALNGEALRVIGQMPDWEPGILGGEPVAVEYVLPITFRLAD